MRLRRQDSTFSKLIALSQS